MKIRALVLALALALPAAPASAAPLPAARAAAVRHVGWVRALRLMRRDWWCERTAPGRFACTSADLDPYENIVALDRGDLLWLLRHDYACTGGGAAVGFTWDCTPA